MRVSLLMAEKKYQEAEAAIAAAHLPQPARALKLLELKLAQRAVLPAGAGRFAAEEEIFRLLKTLGQGKGSEARLGMLAVTSGAFEPAPGHAAEAWALLAQAYELKGDAARAAALNLRAATRAEELGHFEPAAGYRLRAGGLLFQAGKFADADALLSRVSDDARAGALRARASMLRAMARGRALAAGNPGVTPESYTLALEQQIHDFPKDATTDEARWLLGSLCYAAAEKDRAKGLWTAIAPGSPRWVDARLAVAELDRAAVESQLVSGDRHRIGEAYNRARTFLTESEAAARGERAQAELWLAETRLELVPLAGKPRQALNLLERLGRMVLTPQERYRSRLLRMIALVQVGPPYLDAEREAQTHASWAEPAARGAFLDAVRLIDACASYSAIDLHQRRLGLIQRLLVQPVAQVDDEDRWTAQERAELKLRLARAYLFLGDERNAREALRNWTGVGSSASDDLLRDLADTYNRLEAYELAIDVERLRSRNLHTGSVAWFEARYGLALAYFHAERLKDAAQLIDATAILHPDLGGGELQKKFVKLRQRLGTR